MRLRQPSDHETRSLPMRTLPLALAMLTLAACASGPPTVTFEARGFVKEYVRQRDRVRDETKPARDKCARLAPTASDRLREKCDTLKADADAWAGYDAAVLEALMTRQTIRT